MQHEGHRNQLEVSAGFNLKAFNRPMSPSSHDELQKRATKARYGDKEKAW